MGERRASGERELHLSDLPPDAPLRGLAAAVEARRACERAHRQLKRELGLGRFEGVRSSASNPGPACTGTRR